MATILSAQCTDVRVNMTTPALFKRCRTPGDYLAIPQEELEQLIRPTGFFRQKARAIKEACAGIVERFGGEVPTTIAEMVTLHGVGRKTAAVVTSNAFGAREGIAVDTHVSARLPPARSDAPEGSSQDRAGADAAVPARALARGLGCTDLPRQPGVRRPPAAV